MLLIQESRDNTRYRELLLGKIVLRNIEDPNSSTREIARKSSCFYMGNIKEN